MNKYIFKPYHEIFPKLFEQEKLRLSKYLTGEYMIEHIGSTAVPGLGGKGIIDIMISVSKDKMRDYSRELEKVGYEFVERSSNNQRLFHWQDLPDDLERIRRYHVHLTFLISTEWMRALAFRDYLRVHPEAVEKYASIKKQAVGENKVTKEEYMDKKEPVINEILEKALSTKGDPL